MKALFFITTILSLVSCGQNNTSNAGSYSANETIVTQQSIDNGDTVEFIEPRYMSNGQSLKLWGYGEPFERMNGGGGMGFHREGICIKLMGQGASYVSSTESTSVPVGEVGAILSNYDGTTVKHVGNYEFTHANTRPVSYQNEYYYPTERNYSITSITCRKSNNDNSQRSRRKRNRRNRRN